MEDPPLDGDDAPIVEEVARDLIQRRGGDNAARYAREQAEAAVGQHADVAEIWHDIADVIERLVTVFAFVSSMAIPWILIATG